MTVTRAVLLSLGCLAGACRETPSTRFPTVGTDLYNVAPEQITEVTVVTRDQSLRAFRPRPSDPFSLVVTRRSPYRADTCQSGPAFTSWLRAVSRLPIIGRPVRGIDPESPDWIQLRLADGPRGQPVEATLFLALAGEPALVAVRDSQFYAGLTCRPQGPFAPVAPG